MQKKLNQALYYLNNIYSANKREVKSIYKHLVSLLLVTVIIVVMINMFIGNREAFYDRKSSVFDEYNAIENIDLNDPLHRKILHDALLDYYKSQPETADSINNAIELYVNESFTDENIKTGIENVGLTWGMFWNIIGMFIPFVLVYVFVIVIVYYLTRFLGMLRYFLLKSGKSSLSKVLLNKLKTKLKKGDWYKQKDFYALIAQLLPIIILKGIAYLVLFTPAYVIAYSIRSKINTDTYLFLIMLAILSNGLLVYYTNKFFTFLLHESRKGYVETAIVKNMENGYDYKKLFSGWRYFVFPEKMFTGHVFGHILKNAGYQYLLSIKEMASFTITGLIIIEMALNIQGHLGYEMLKNVLYKNYDIVGLVVLLLFYLLKLNEIVVDFIHNKMSAVYENRSK